MEIAAVVAVLLIGVGALVIKKRREAEREDED